MDSVFVKRNLKEVSEQRLLLCDQLLQKTRTLIKVLSSSWSWTSFTKGSHQLKKKGILWIKFIKRWPPPPSHFYEFLFFFSRPKCAYVVIFATKVRVFYDFRDKRTRMLWFLRQKCLLCDFCNKNARMLWFSRQQLCFWYFWFKLLYFPSF